MAKLQITRGKEVSSSDGILCEVEQTNFAGSIPVTLDFANILGLNILLLPVGRGDDGAHSTNEKIDTDNYIRVSATNGY
jgi:acetylornithine deacetylase/succinyl-diaminopimelate desuccinylase-like protein